MSARGAVLRRGQPWYTDLSAVLLRSGDLVTRCNWMLTGWECNRDLPELKGDCAWLTGAQFSALLKRYAGVQWIWGLAAGFDREVPRERALAHRPLPHAERCAGLEGGQIRLQHPLARVEVAACDSSCCVWLCREQADLDAFLAAFPQSETLKTQ